MINLQEKEKQNIILRFAVMSDLHYSDKHSQVRQRFESALNTVYGYAKKQPYNSLDALYVVGDFTDRGLPSELEMFKEDCDKYVSYGTKLVITLANHELHYYSDTESMRIFSELFGMELDRHEIIGGYHFISLSTMQYGGKWHDSFDEEKRGFLRRALEEARADGHGKPIFVFQHPGVKGTVLGGLFGNDELADILDNYPEVIDFSGHSHCPVNDPKEISQRRFTAVSTGSLYNICQRHKSGLYPYIDSLMKDESEYAHMLVCEVDENSTVYIKKLDVLAGDFFEYDWNIDKFGDISSFKYNDERGRSAKAPYFDCGVVPMAVPSDGGILLEFPAAHGASERVKEYHISFSDESGVFYKTVLASDYPSLVQKEKISVKIDNIGKTRFDISIKAAGFWENFSDEISTEVSL